MRLLPGESLLLVSDGVTLHLSDDALAACLNSNDLAANVQRIFDEVMAQGAEDNLSAIAMSMKSGKRCLNHNSRTLKIVCPIFLLSAGRGLLPRSSSFRMVQK